MTTDRIIDLLEDFDVVGNQLSIVLIPMDRRSSTLRQNIEAAIFAASMRLKSMDYAKKTYLENQTSDILPENEEREYIAAYKTAKQHMLNLMSKFSEGEQPPPSNGMFGASLVLERLPISFFSAHLLYRLGNRYEAHAVSRLILEQIAWAHAAYQLDNIDDIKKIETTKTISKLKKIIPKCGVLYGFLSDKTHIDYASHGDFLRIEEGQSFVLHTQHQFYEYAQVILHLADWFGIVWEMSQYEYLSEIESIEVKDNIYTVKPDRPFLALIQEHLRKIKNHYNNKIQPTTDGG
jgi:hypothetical protein